MSATNYSPVFRNPFTDLTAGLMVQQHFSRCSFFEMRFIECLEAYGADRAFRDCKLQQADFQECVTQKKQELRYEAIKKERARQAKEKGKAAHMPAPPKDAYDNPLGKTGFYI